MAGATDRHGQRQRKPSDVQFRILGPVSAAGGHSGHHGPAVVMRRNSTWPFGCISVLVHSALFFRNGFLAITTGEACQWAPTPAAREQANCWSTWSRLEELRAALAGEWGSAARTLWSTAPSATEHSP